MKYMLDTNTCIFCINHVSKVLSSFEIKKGDGIVISSIVLAELEFGVCNSAFYENNKITLETFLSTIDVLPFDELAAAKYGQVRTALQKRGKPIGAVDMFIAAHAKAAGLILVTNNTKEFMRVDGLKIEDWT